jgi:HD superfamily phosphohydrolase YqeK
MLADAQPYMQSLLFDKELIGLGRWHYNDREEIEQWNATTDYELQRTKAAHLITYLIQRILNVHCSSTGKIRARRLGKALANLEQILISSRNLEKKFYRDHLNHVIRVALLARAIGKKSPFNLSKADMDKLVLACLFHDVAYPLSEIGQSFRSTIRALKDCYNIASGISQGHDIGLIPNKKSLVAVLAIEEKTINKQLEELDHGLLSALEFISYLKGNYLKNYKDVIRAIAFHDPSFGFETDEKLLTILILADELQDWGRPVNRTLMPKITNFRLKNNVLKGNFDTEKVSDYSVLRQIYSKSLNLSRIRLPTNYRFMLRFPLQNLTVINFKEFAMSLQTLYKKCIKLEERLFEPSFFKKLYEGNSMFENIYYGLSIPKEIKDKIHNLLDYGSISSSSPSTDYNILMNEDQSELLFVSSDIDKIDNFTFRSNPKDSIVLEITNSGIKHTGQLKSISDQKVNDLALFLIAEVRFYNICIQKIVKFESKPYPVEIGIEGFPNTGEISRLLKKVKKIGNSKLLEHLRPIRDSISDRGVFLFELTN